MTNIIPHEGCMQLEARVRDPLTPLDYDPRRRAFYIRADDNAPVTNFSFCPYCSEKLPDDLTDRWWDELEKEGIRSLDELDQKGVPQHLRSDAWWRFLQI